MAARSDPGALRFDGAVAIVTGAGRGLGRDYALQLAARGAAIVVIDVDQPGVEGKDDPASAVMREITDRGGRAIAVHADMSDPASCDIAVGRALERVGRIDILVNNAGSSHHRPVEQLRFADISHRLQTHVGGSLHMARAAWPALARGKAGRIILTGSNVAFWGQRHNLDYCCAKGGVAALNALLAAAGARDGVMVNCVSPRAATRLADNIEDGSLRERFKADLAVTRVAPLVLLLAHSECRFTGETFDAGGGLVRPVVEVARPLASLSSPAGNTVLGGRIVLVSGADHDARMAMFARSGATAIGSESESRAAADGAREVAAVIDRVLAEHGRIDIISHRFDRPDAPSSAMYRCDEVLRFVERQLSRAYAWLCAGLPHLARQGAGTILLENRYPEGGDDATSLLGGCAAGMVKALGLENAESGIAIALLRLFEERFRPLPDARVIAAVQAAALTGACAGTVYDVRSDRTCRVDHAIAPGVGAADLSSEFLLANLEQMRDARGCRIPASAYEVVLDTADDGQAPSLLSNGRQA